MPDGSQFGDPRANMLVNLPNIITFARLCAVPVAVGLVLYQRPLVAFWLFAAAGLSDALDGWLARRRGITLIGAILDPVAGVGARRHPQRPAATRRQRRNVHPQGRHGSGLPAEAAVFRMADEGRLAV